MNRRGVGYAHEILMGMFLLVIILLFYGRDYVSLVAPMCLMLGFVMILGGLVTREPMLTAGGFILIAIAIVFPQLI